MKPSPTKFTALLAVGLFTVLAMTAHAATFASVTNTASYNGLDGLIVTNLLQAGQTSLASVSASHAPASGWLQSALNDGVGNPTAGGTAGLVYYPISGSGSADLPVTITFNLNTNSGTGGSANGYDITSVQAISGWKDTYIANQNFQVLLSINGGPYNNYGGFVGTSTLGSGNNSVMTTVLSSSGPIARNVTGIQFVFTSGVTSSTANGGIVLHELQAFGTPSPTNAVPSPYRICCVGDSITSGYTDPSAWTVPFEFGYRGGVMTRLVTNGMSFQFVGGSSQPWGLTDGVVTNIPSPDLRIAGQDHFEGYSGKNTAFILGNISAWLSVDQPDILLLMIGINDLGNGGDPTPTELNLSNLVATVVSQSPNTRLIVAQITPVVTYQDSIVQYNNYIANVLVPYFAGLGKHVTTVNQYTNMCYPGTTNIDLALFGNGINHPNDTSYDQMAQTWFNGIEALSLPPPQPCAVNANLVINGGFETPVYYAASHNIMPQGAGWGFTAGISGAGSGIDVANAYGGSQNANTYEGKQRGFIQSSGNSSVTHLYQSVSGFTVGQYYQLSFWSEGLQTPSGPNPFHAGIINGTSTNVLTFGGTNTIVPPASAYVLYTSAPFQASNAVMTLDFFDNGLSSAGYVSWVDAVGIYPITNLNLLVNGSFEVPDFVVGPNYNASHNVNPSGAGWIFTAGVSGAGSGIDRNDCFSSDAYHPSGSIGFDGAQQADLQSSGNGTVSSISQTVSNLTVGQYYMVSFAAKAITGFSGANPFQVQIISGTATNLLFGGADVTPGSAGYSYYSSPFQAASPVVTLAFVDHGLSIVSCVSWIDDVSLYAVPPVPIMPPVPIIIQNTLPATAATVVGDNLTFTAAFSSSPAANYQWLFITGGATNAIAGATNATLTLNNLQLTNSGAYLLEAVNATNSLGINYSTAAPLTVSSVPAAVNNVITELAAQTGLGPVDMLGTSFTPAWTVVTNHSLIAGQAPSSASGNFSVDISGRSVNSLTAGGNGTISVIGVVGSTATSTNYVTCGNGSGAGASVIYTLTGWSHDWSLTNVTVYGGWTDGGRDAQDYTVYYSTVAAPAAFILLGSVSYNPANAAYVESATRATLVPAAGALATNVAAVKFDFTSPGSENGYCGYSQITLFGVALTNHPPVASALAFSTVFGQSVTVNVINGTNAPTDADGDPLTVSAVGVPANGTAGTDGTSITYTPTSGFAGTDSFTYTVADGFGGTATATVTVTVGNPNGLGGRVSGIVFTNGVVGMTFTGIPGYQYHVQASTNLTSWNDVLITNAPAGGVFQFNSSASPMPDAYYRLMWNGN